MITEAEKDKAIETLRQFEIEATHEIRDNIEDDCGTKDYKKGTPKGSCEGDGHYMCQTCVNYRT